MKRASDRIDFPKDVIIIKGYLKEAGIDYDLIECNILWEWFSDDIYSAGFMIVNEKIVAKFIEWLKEE